jgi:hypothetical protein
MGKESGTNRDRNSKSIALNAAMSYSRYLKTIDAIYCISNPIPTGT